MEHDSGAASKAKEPPTPVAFIDSEEYTSEEPAEWGIPAFLVLLIAANVCAVIGTLYGPKMIWSPVVPVEKRESRPRSFYDADGSTAYEYDVVPDIIHIIRYNQTELTITDVIFLRSMYLNHRPGTFMVHCSPCGFTGPLVNWTDGINFTFVPHVFPDEVFGRKIKVFLDSAAMQVIHHSTDVARIRILMQYGGIYLDRDVFVVNSLRRFLRYEATLPVPPQSNMGNNLMILHKDARFLKLYLETYREFNDSLWYENAGHIPTIKVLQKHPHLYNRIYFGLEVQLDMLYALYAPHAYPNWRSAYAVHTFYRLGYGAVNQANMRDLDSAIGQMARSVLFGTSDFVGPDVPVASVGQLAARKDSGEDLTNARLGSEKPFYVR